jgi:hypothetical protein
MGWAQHLKRVFGIDVQGVQAPPREVKVIARIEDLKVVENIQLHLNRSDQVGMDPSGVWLTRRKNRSSLELVRYVPVTANHELQLWGVQFNDRQVRVWPVGGSQPTGSFEGRFVTPSRR